MEEKKLEINEETSKNNLEVLTGTTVNPELFGEIESEDKFKENLQNRYTKAVQDLFERNIYLLKSFIVVSKYRSFRRAFKRGHCDIYGTLYPKRPFHNRGNKSTRKGVSSHKMNDLKKEIYGQYIKKSLKAATA